MLRGSMPPPEEAVIEAPVEIDQAGRSEQVNDTANKILDALRSNWTRTGTAHRRCRNPRCRTCPRLDSATPTDTFDTHAEDPGR